MLTVLICQVKDNRRAVNPTPSAGLNQTQKATRRKNQAQERSVRDALKQAEAGDPALTAAEKTA